MNILSIHAIKNAPAEMRERLIEIIKSEDSSDREIKEAIEIVKKTDAIEYAARLAEKFGEKARDELKKFPSCACRDRLELLIEAVLERCY